MTARILALSLLWPSLAFGQTVQLSHGQSFSEIYLAQSFPQATTERVVYVQDATTNNAHELWSVPLAGGVPVRLSNALAPNQSVEFQISADGQRVVYRTDQATLGRPELWSVPIAGGASVKLSMTLTGLTDHVGDFVLSPTAPRAYYRAKQNEVVELWSVPISGGASTKINKTLPASNYDVFEHYQASAADQVVYRVGRTVQGGHELWMVPGSGHGSQARRISISPMVTGGGVDSDFRIVGDRVVYRADANDNGREDLFSVPVAGGVSTRLDRQDGRSVRTDWGIDGASVVYSYTNSEWYRVPVLGGVSVAVAPPVEHPVTSPNGQYTLREVGASLWSERSDGLWRRVSCVGQVVTMRWLNRPVYSVSADSETVAYVGDGALWSGPISGAVCEIFRDGFESGNQGAWQ